MVSTNLKKVTIPVKGVSVYKMNSKEIPQNSYLVCMNPAREILFKPWMTGIELQVNAKEAARLFLRTAYYLTPLKTSSSAEVCELVALCGGLYYRLSEGYGKVFGAPLQRCFVGAKRFMKNDGKNWDTAITYGNFEALPRTSGVILVGDTIATGGTLKRMIDELVRNLERKKCSPQALVIFSIAGSYYGAKVLKKIEDDLRKKWPNFKVYIFYAQAAFGLMPNGTDLKFLHKDSILPEEMRVEIEKRYGEYLGKEMKCAIFDWGDRCKNPKRHLREFEEFCNSLLRVAKEPKARKVLVEMKRHSEKELARLEDPLRLKGNGKG
ncbi:MAG: hypothetical protein ABIH99_03830 [Candidatus Micrarchaeota archaeon]